MLDDNIPFAGIKSRLDKVGTLPMICVQLLLASLAIYQFNIELHLGLPQLMPFVFVSFVINALLPKTQRLPFFFFASLAPIFYFFGWQDASLLIAVALLMIGVCHLPLALWIRKLGVVVLGGSLAYAKWCTTRDTPYTEDILILVPATSQIISILGTMFMFRMIIYLYELKYEEEEVSIWQRLSYFFLLPNICFPIFPIVDYETFKSSYYNESDEVIYQKGIQLIVLGVIQLLIYRVMYYLAPSVGEVDDFWSLLGYLVFSYLMLLRLNGILNIAVGLLRLFGFNLPDIFNYMFLSQGFDDLWRRVNIYWKDFMARILYFPIYFAFKRKSKTKAIIIGVSVTFIFNWAFHSYQWFWILGEFSLRETEMITWGVLGALVLLFMLRQQRQSEQRKVVTPTSPQRARWNTALLILFTFLSMTLVYSFMISPSVAAWLKVMQNLSTVGFMDGLLLLVICLLMVLLYVGITWLKSQEKLDHWLVWINESQKIVALNCVLLFSVLLLSTPLANRGIKKLTGYSARSFIAHHLNVEDQRKQFKGYYEELMFADNFSSALWQMEYQKTKDWQGISSLDILEYKSFAGGLKPSSETVFKQKKLTTNRWGMRDQAYRKERPEQTRRIAIVGGSAEMGSGVNDEEVFEQVLEQQLNAAQGRDSTHFEVLNFAISGMSVLRNLERMRTQIMAFQPQTILVFAHKGERIHVNKTLKWMAENEGTAIVDTVPWMSPFRDHLSAEGLTYSNLASDKEKIALGEVVVRWAYQAMKTLCDANEVEMILVFNPGIVDSEPVDQKFAMLAEQLGISFINLQNIYEGYEQEGLQLVVWDNHPNALGHKILADSLYTKLLPFLPE